MEALLIIGALAAGAHYMNSDEPNQIHSSQTTAQISNFRADLEQEALMASVDWSKPGNFVVGDSPETGVQWVFITD